MEMDEFNYSLYERKLDMLREYGLQIETDERRDYFFMDDQMFWVEDIDDVAEFLNL